MTTVTNTDAPSQLDQQLELLCSFNVQVPCNPQGDFAASSFKILLHSLNTNQICDSLRGSYHDVHLKNLIRSAEHRSTANFILPDAGGKKKNREISSLI